MDDVDSGNLHYGGGGNCPPCVICVQSMRQPPSLPHALHTDTYLPPSIIHTQSHFPYYITITLEVASAKVSYLLFYRTYSNHFGFWSVASLIIFCQLVPWPQSCLLGLNSLLHSIVAVSTLHVHLFALSSLLKKTEFFFIHH